MSFVPSRVIATVPRPPPTARDREVHPFARTSTTPSVGPISHISLPVSRESQEPVLKPKTWSVERDKNTSPPAEEIVPPRIPPHASKVPAPRRVPPPTLDLSATADWAQEMHMRIPRRAPAPSINTPDLTTPSPRSTPKPNTRNTPVSAYPHKPYNAVPLTTPTSGHSMASPRPTRTLPQPPPLRLETVALRAPGVGYTTSTRALEYIDKRGVDVKMQHLSRPRKAPDPPLDISPLYAQPSTYSLTARTPRVSESRRHE